MVPCLPEIEEPGVLPLLPAVVAPAPVELIIRRPALTVPEKNRTSYLQEADPYPLVTGKNRTCYLHKVGLYSV